jgi:hypothetical protein
VAGERPREPARPRSLMIYPSAGDRPKPGACSPAKTPAQQRLFDLFGLNAYGPRA